MNEGNPILPKNLPQTDRQIDTWIIAQVAQYLGCEPEAVHRERTLAELGLGSVQMLAICGDAEDAFNVVVDPSAVIDDPTVLELAAALQHIVEDDERA